jgi:hypothetical protein
MVVEDDAGLGIRVQVGLDVRWVQGLGIRR